MKRLVVLFFILLISCSKHEAQVSLVKIDVFRSLFEISRSRVFFISIEGAGSGTAFNIKHNGKILTITNRHVCNINREDPVDDSMANREHEYFELKQEGKNYIAKIQKLSKKTDLCLVSILTPDLELDSFVYSDVPLKEGDPIYAYGHPYARILTPSYGRFKQFIKFPTDDFFGIMSALYAGVSDVPIYPGSSGSPVLDNSGGIVGIMFAMNRSDSLFIPTSEIKEFLNE